MSETIKNLLSDGEIKEKLIAIYNEVKSKTERYDTIMKKYDVSQYVILDLSSMELNEFENLLESITDIKDDIKNRKKIREISANLGCGSNIIGYIVKNTCENYKKQTSSNEQFAALCKQTEQIWKQYKKGDTIKKLSCKYNIDEQELEILLNSFDSSLRDKKLYYKNLRKVINPEEKKQKLKEKFDFDDDTIAYIVDGKEIGISEERGE